MLRATCAALLVTASLPAAGAGAQIVGADLRVASRFAPSSAAVGDDVTVNATVTNGGPEEATDVTLTVELPRGVVLHAVAEAPGPCSPSPPVSCSIGTLAPGGSAQVRLLVGVARGGAWVAAALAAAAQEDPNAANDQASAELAASGQDCDRLGTAGPDRLRAPRAGGVACGFAGHDVLLGSPRGDDLLGGADPDSLVGGAGRDGIDGGEGIDACSGGPGPGVERGCERRVFALAGPLPLVEPAPGAGYGYHQSLFGTAIGLAPLEPGVVMSSRGRGTGGTTAADVVIGPRSRVAAPVTGRVLAVKRYRLYCERPDWKLVIAPLHEPNLRVLVLHLGRPTVRKGSEVTGGVSALGRARPSDWEDSQVQRYFAGARPHVHVEVERDRASPTPGCAA